MTSTNAFLPADAGPTPAIAALRARIGRLCRLLRLAAPLYALWVLILLAMHWSSAADATASVAFWTRAAITEIPASGRLHAFLLQLPGWGLLALACFHLWRLFSGFLAGEVFTLEATTRLRCTATAGFAAMAAEVVSRPLVVIVSTLHMPPGSRHVALFFQPGDLLNLMFLGGLLALAQVFRVAAEIAEDNAAIV